ncbi:SCO5918 family protein [Streptomyces asoensis]|uniref:SCO5918 family protein n=1 Tax=Streptomyces asoensis TaxID=249586 RepID=UPI0037204A3D
MTASTAAGPSPRPSPCEVVGRRTYPAKQAGQVVTRQDRRDFSADEVLRAMTQLGFTCRDHSRTVAPARPLSTYQEASAMLGATAAV